MFGFSPLGFGLYITWRGYLVPGYIFFLNSNIWLIQILKVDFIISRAEGLEPSGLAASLPLHLGLCCEECRNLNPRTLYFPLLDSWWYPGRSITALNLSDSVFLGCEW